MRSSEEASAASFSLGRAVAATVTPADASRRATSPQIAPEAPVIHASFQGNFSAKIHLPVVIPVSTGLAPDGQ